MCEPPHRVDDPSSELPQQPPGPTRPPRSSRAARSRSPRSSRAGLVRTRGYGGRRFPAGHGRRMFFQQSCPRRSSACAWRQERPPARPCRYRPGSLRPAARPATFISPAGEAPMLKLSPPTLRWQARLLAVVIVVITSMALLVAYARPAAADPSVLYVDNGSPNCSVSGPGTSTIPFCTIGKGASVAVAGQTAQVASGTYAELVTVKNSGAAGSPIVLTAAPGASVAVSGMANGFKVSGKSYVTVQGFTVSSTTSYGIFVTGSSNVTVSGNTVSNTGSHGIYVTNSSTNVTVSGNTVSGTASYGIYVTGSSNVTVSGNDVSAAGQPVQGYTKYGIKLASSTSSSVSGNTAHNNSDAGIFLDASTNGVEVTGNQTYGNARGYARAAPGIDVRGYSNTIDRNVSHDNEDSGLQFYAGSHDNLVVDNLTYNNGDHGIDNLGATNQTVISNTVYNNVTAGINVEGSSTGATVENHISVDNGINSPRTHSDIRV